MNSVVTPDILKNLREIIRHLNGLGIRFYVHAGIGLALHGLSGETDDIDIRVNCEDLEGLCNKLAPSYQDQIRIIKNQTFTEGTYGGNCIKLNTTPPIDLCSNMRAIRRDIDFIFPYSSQCFSDSKHVLIEDVAIPVASLENLLLYYLIFRRNEIDNKNDEHHIQEIVKHPDFDFTKFYKIIDKHPLEGKVRQLLHLRIQS